MGVVVVGVYWWLIQQRETEASFIFIVEKYVESFDIEKHTASMLHRKPVEELLQRVFSSCDDATSAALLKQLCLAESSVTFKPVHSRLRFITSDCGGVKLIVTDGSRLVMRVALLISVRDLRLHPVCVTHD